MTKLLHLCSENRAHRTQLSSDYSVNVDPRDIGPFTKATIKQLAFYRTERNAAAGIYYYRVGYVAITGLGLNGCVEPGSAKGYYNFPIVLDGLSTDIAFHTVDLNYTIGRNRDALVPTSIEVILFGGDHKPIDMRGWDWSICIQLE